MSFSMRKMGKKGKMENRLCESGLLHLASKMKPRKPARMAECTSIANVLAIDWSQLSQPQQAAQPGEQAVDKEQAGAIVSGLPALGQSWMSLAVVGRQAGGETGVSCCCKKALSFSCPCLFWTHSCLSRANVCSGPICSLPSFQQWIPAMAAW